MSHKTRGVVNTIRSGKGAVIYDITCQFGSKPASGQYFSVTRSANPSQAYPDTLYPFSSKNDGILAISPQPVDYQPGTQLILHGPFGTGFKLAPELRKILFICINTPAFLFTGVIMDAVQIGMEITLCAEGADSLADELTLPSAVEILPLSEMAAGVAWANQVFLIMPPGEFAGFSSEISLIYSLKMLNTQVLLLDQFPCGGFGTCGVCEIHTPQGWKTTCTHGPVFQLSDLV